MHQTALPAPQAAPGRLNVKMGLAMLITALCLGIVLNQIQPLGSNASNRASLEQVEQVEQVKQVEQASELTNPSGAISSSTRGSTDRTDQAGRASADPDRSHHSQSQSPAFSTGGINWDSVPVEDYAWWIVYAYLGNMGLLNIGGGLVLVIMGSRILGRQWLGQLLLMGGLIHPGAWVLIALTGITSLRWVGWIGAGGVGLVLAVLFLQLIFRPHRWMTKVDRV